MRTRTVRTFDPSSFSLSFGTSGGGGVGGGLRLETKDEAGGAEGEFERRHDYAHERNRRGRQVTESAEEKQEGVEGLDLRTGLLAADRW